MADLRAIRKAIASQVAANTLPALSASGEFQGLVNPPMLLVFPRPPVSKFDICLGGGVIEADGNPMSPTEFQLKGALVVAKADIDSNVQDYLDQWLGSVRTASTVTVAQAIEMDPTLGGLVEWCITTIISSYGPIEWSGAKYFGASFEWGVSAR